MRIIKVGAAILNQTPLDWEGNQRNIISAVRAARGEQTNILCLPELCISGYGCEDAFLSPGVQRTAFEVLKEIIPACGGLAVCLGLPLYYESALFDAVAVVIDGKLSGFVCKKFLAREGIHYEPRWFKAWPAGKSARLEINGGNYALGDLLFEIDGIRLGFEICEDAWAHERPGQALAAQGVDLILNPSASHFAFGKFEVRKRFVLEGSRAFGAAYVYANLTGNEAGRAIYDGGALIAAGGNLAACGPRFVFSDFHLTTAPIDIDAIRVKRAARPDSARGRGSTAYRRVEVKFKFVPPQAQSDITAAQLGEADAAPKAEEFARAVALGLFDYLRKSRSHGFVISLSGGADSSAAACLVWIMAELALRELGLEGVVKRLAHIDALSRAHSGAEMMQALLTCVYQAAENSSRRTREAACAVSREIGACYLEFEIADIVKRYVDLAQAGLGRKLDWERDDAALQNIQARARGPAVWLLANVKKAILLATSNRSEAAVGYTTMDGDTCGGLSPLGGIDKAFLRSWLRQVEKEGICGLPALPALSLVNAQAPTAELRPPQRNQTDEQDLMPYELLDEIERYAIRDKKTPLEVYALAVKRFKGCSPQQLAAWVVKFFGLWSHNQWKRERYAPSFHLDDENLDPKSWCRFPVLSGGFAREIGELERIFVKEGGDGVC